MATKPTRKPAKKPAQRGRTSLARIVEKDLDVPTGTAGSVKGGRPRLRPALVPIPPCK